MGEIGLTYDEMRDYITEYMGNTLYDKDFMQMARNRPAGKQLSDMEIGLVSMASAVAATIQKNNEKLMADLKRAGMIGD